MINRWGQSKCLLPNNWEDLTPNILATVRLSPSFVFFFHICFAIFCSNINAASTRRRSSSRDQDRSLPRHQPGLAGPAITQLCSEYRWRRRWRWRWWTWEVVKLYSSHTTCLGWMLFRRKIGKRWKLSWRQRMLIPDYNNKCIFCIWRRSCEYFKACQKQSGNDIEKGEIEALSHRWALSMALCGYASMKCKSEVCVRVWGAKRPSLGPQGPMWWGQGVTGGLQR